MLICEMLNQAIQFFLKTYNTEFDDIVITFIDQNGRTLEIEDKISLTKRRTKQKTLQTPTNTL